MLADQKFGHLAKNQEYQLDTIIGGWGATAKAGDYATAKAGDIATASENVTVVTATTEKA